MTELNPKDAEACALGKTPLDLLEPVADKAIAEALAYGANKYGRQNYLQTPIRLRTYIAAIKRHSADILDGEDAADDSGLSHWAHIGATVHVVLAAKAAGTLIDDRGPENPTVVNHRAGYHPAEVAEWQNTWDAVMGGEVD